MNKTIVFKKIWKRSLQYLRPQIFIIFVNLATVVFAALLPFLIKNFIDSLTSGVISHLLRLGGFIIVIATLERICNFWANYLFQRIARRGVCDLQIELYSNLQKLPMMYFSKTETGTVMAKVLSDAQILGQMIAISFAMLIANITTLVAVVIVLMLLSPFLAGIAFLSLPIYYLIFRHYNRKLRKTSAAERKSFAKVSESLREKVEAIKMIKGFSKEENFSKMFKKDVSSWFERIKKQVFVNTLSLNLGGYVTYIIPLIVLFIGGTKVIAGALSLGTLIGFWEFMSRLYEPVQNLAEWNNAIQQSLPAGERVFGLLEEKKEPNEGKKLDLGTAPKIEFQDVWFNYEKSTPAVLKGFSLILPPGKAIALVGASGSGKSTVVSLLFRFYNKKKGKISINDMDIMQYSIDSIRNSFALVEQNSFLLNSSIKDNIFLDDEFSDDILYEVSELCLVNDFVSQLPSGYNTRVGEKGVTLSAGQIQRISLARAVIRNPKVLVLDEATSALDSEIEEKVFRNIKEFLTDTTIFIVAHRLSTIREADEIAVITDGQISAVGTHEYLLEACPEYVELVKKQIITD